MMDSRKDEIRHQLWHSVEMGYYKRQFLICLILFPVAAVIASIRSRPSSLTEHGLFLILLVAAFMLPPLTFYGFRMVRILQSPERYIFSQTELKEPHGAVFTRNIYFTILLKDDDGSTFCADTHAIFAVRGVVDPVMDNYVNQTVTVGYNPVTGMVVVIG